VKERDRDREKIKREKEKKRSEIIKVQQIEMGAAKV